jgi:hypothetical protein
VSVGSVVSVVSVASVVSGESVGSRDVERVGGVQRDAIDGAASAAALADALIDAVAARGDQQ